MATLAETLGTINNSGKFWTHPWGLIRGCTPRSTGCIKCWMVRMARLAGDTDLLTKDEKHFNGTVRCMEGLLTAPISGRKRKPRVWAIWTDFYHEDVPDSFRDSAFEVMSQCPSDYFLIITKRPHIAMQYFIMRGPRRGEILPNVIHLVTMEDQWLVGRRMQYVVLLASMGWKVGALCEPLMEPVDLFVELSRCGGITPGGTTALSWIIAGAETGQGARSAEAGWFRSLRDQAQHFGVPFLLKHISSREGRLLDEMEWNEVPK